MSEDGTREERGDNQGLEENHLGKLQGNEGKQKVELHFGELVRSDVEDWSEQMLS